MNHGKMRTGVVTCQTVCGHMSNGCGHMSNGVWSHVKKRRDIYVVFIRVTCQRSPLFGFAAFFVVIAVFTPSLVGVSFAVIHFGETSSNAQGGTRISVVF